MGAGPSRRNLEVSLEEKDDEHHAQDEEDVLQPKKLDIATSALGFHHLSRVPGQTDVVMMHAHNVMRVRPCPDESPPSHPTPADPACRSSAGQATGVGRVSGGGGNRAKTWLSWTKPKVLRPNTVRQTPADIISGCGYVTSATNSSRIGAAAVVLTPTQKKQKQM